MAYSEQNRHLNLHLKTIYLRRVDTSWTTGKVAVCFVAGIHFASTNAGNSTVYEY